MNMDKLVEGFLQKYDAYTDQIIGLSFLREPFSQDLRTWAGLKTDKAFAQAFDAFMLIAHDTFRWEDYLQARTTAEQAFRAFYQQQQYPEKDADAAAQGFIVSFFNQYIDEQQYAWEDAHPNEEPPAVADDDIETLYMARLFSVIPCKAEDEAFCESIGVQYHYEQLHMCVWFSGQVTNGSGQYSRGEANFSARVTYNRLLNPWSLLWIGVVIGADRDALKAAAEEMETKKTNAAKCAAVRSHVPFDTIFQLFQSMMAEEAQ